MKKKGSAFLTVIGIIGVLSILALSFISSSKDKVGISKLMSDEKKAEALAESATDYIIKYIRKNANDHDAAEKGENIEPIYYLLRAPLKAKDERDSDNFILDHKKVLPADLDSIVNYIAILGPSINEIGWGGENGVKITSKCILSNAESFTPLNLNYKVPTIDCEHLRAEGNSAKFLDDDNDSNNGCENYSEEWAPSRWELRLKFPKGAPLYEEKSFEVDFPWYIGDQDITLKISRNSEQTTDLNIRADDLPIIDHKDFHLNIQEEIDGSHFFPEIEKKTLQGLKEAFTNGDLNTAYCFSYYVSSIRERKEFLNKKYKKYIDSFDINTTDFNDPYFIEKGAVIRIETNVKYKNIDKTLVAELPFKVSDVQPIAPEYSFFIANSTNVCNQKDIVSGHVLGTHIDMNRSNSSVKYNATPPSGSFIVHNVPFNSNKVDYTAFSEGKRVPGMVRINSDYTPSNNESSKIRSFLGIVAQPELTEFNKFFTPFNEDFTASKFNTRVSFCWDDTIPQRYHELEFPLLFEHSKPMTPAGTGIENVVRIFKESGFEIVSVPTLLFGVCHMEYPLGLRVEGPIDSIYSRLRLHVRPDGEVDEFYFEDLTEISFIYETVSTYSDGKVYQFNGDGIEKSYNYNKPSTYGMEKYPGYNPNASWNSNGDFKYSPANCYDALQYAKKATKYYEDQSEFKKDLDISVDKDGLKGNNDYTVFNGVYYIKNGNLTIDSPLKYKGNGLVICKKGRIQINNDITRDSNDTTSTLGIIARTGNINFNTSKVMAACFSNNAPTSTASKLDIYGNLVCNDFLRDKFPEINIHYDNTICNVTPFASLRKIGKFEPKRYSVTFADNWSKFAYEKKK